MNPKSLDGLALIYLIAWGLATLAAHPKRTRRMLAGGSFHDLPGDSRA